VQTNFIEKNNDALHDSLEALMLESNSEFIKKIFEPNANTETALVRQKGKLAFISVGNKFRSQLTSLMDKLRSTVSGTCVH
jgi:myosin-6